MSELYIKAVYMLALIISTCQVEKTRKKQFFPNNYKSCVGTTIYSTNYSSSL